MAAADDYLALCRRLLEVLAEAGGDLGRCLLAVGHDPADGWCATAAAEMVLDRLEEAADSMLAALKVVREYASHAGQQRDAFNDPLVVSYLARHWRPKGRR
jgi:hypothetical protein